MSFFYYPVTPPKEVKGGIVSQSKRGSFTKNWWAEQWLNEFIKGADPKRLTRGRSYARAGQVEDLKICPGKVTATVQGHYNKPYRLRMDFKPFTQEEKQIFIQVLKDNPLFLAQLLNGFIPEEFAQKCFEQGVILLPGFKNHRDYDCDCLDWGHPCKHLAALFYLLAEAMDNNPFLMFQMLGLEKDEILAELELKTDESIFVEEESQEREDLPADPELFWKEYYNCREMNLERPQLHAAIIKRLGNITFWRSKINFRDKMEEIYTRVGKRAEDILEQ